jgi:hypothetical protein
MRQPSPRALFQVLPVCLSLVACGGGIDKAAKADIERRVAVMSPSGLFFPAPSVFAPRPLAIGQWTQHKLTNAKGEQSFVTYKVVDRTSDAYWIEVANESYYGKTVAKLLVAVGDRMHPDTMEIRAIRLKDKKGKISEVGEPALTAMKPAWQRAMNMLAVSWQGLPQEAMQVVAGDFAACFKARTDVSWGGWQASATTWMHPAVPINSLVKSTGIDRPTSMELVGFGETGAKSEIP